MSAGFHEIEAEIRYLLTVDGGRKTGVSNGYKGQFHYGGNDYDGFQYFPDVPTDQMIDLGRTVRAIVKVLQDRWDDVHSKQITVGMQFEIREGARTVGRGTVTKV